MRPKLATLTHPAERRSGLNPTITPVPRTHLVIAALRRPAETSRFFPISTRAGIAERSASPIRPRWEAPCCGNDPAKIQAMAKVLTADDILPLVDSLTPEERVRLQRLIARPQGGDASVYRSVPPSRDEFSADDEPLAWDAEGWEQIG